MPATSAGEVDLEFEPDPDAGRDAWQLAADLLKTGAIVVETRARLRGKPVLCMASTLQPDGDQLLWVDPSCVEDRRVRDEHFGRIKTRLARLQGLSKSARGWPLLRRLQSLAATAVAGGSLLDRFAGLEILGAAWLPVLAIGVVSGLAGPLIWLWRLRTAKTSYADRPVDFGDPRLSDDDLKPAELASDLR